MLSHHKKCKYFRLLLKVNNHHMLFYWYLSINVVEYWYVLLGDIRKSYYISKIFILSKPAIWTFTLGLILSFLLPNHIHSFLLLKTKQNKAKFQHYITDYNREIKGSSLPVTICCVQLTVNSIARWPEHSMIPALRLPSCLMEHSHPGCHGHSQLSASPPLVACGKEDLPPPGHQWGVEAAVGNGQLLKRLNIESYVTRKFYS